MVSVLSGLLFKRYMRKMLVLYALTILKLLYLGTENLNTVKKSQYLLDFRALFEDF